jgi:hypothetical protein
MLVLRRKEGQWVEVTHKSGDTIRIRVYNIRSRYPSQLDLGFQDETHSFRIQRPERVIAASPGAGPTGRAPGAGAEDRLDPRSPRVRPWDDRRDDPDLRAIRPLAHSPKTSEAAAEGIPQPS